MLAGMTITRMDNVGIVVADLDAAVSFFEELGMELEGRGKIEGIWADRTVGLDGIQSEIAMMRTPDAHSKLELTRYDSPLPTADGSADPPPNTLGLHRVMFTVDDIDDTIARLRTHGGAVREHLPALLPPRTRRNHRGSGRRDRPRVIPLRPCLRARSQP
jgi:catechol 2,3-dioxygenase-like lactoylglutathione lyase family enzyme